MSPLLLKFSESLAATTCVTLAGYFAVLGKEWWGWFLIAGIVIAFIARENKEH